jgi:hypothetical protein
VRIAQVMYTLLSNARVGAPRTPEIWTEPVGKFLRPTAKFDPSRPKFSTAGSIFAPSRRQPAPAPGTRGKYGLFRGTSSIFAYSIESYTNTREARFRGAPVVGFTSSLGNSVHLAPSAIIWPFGTRLPPGVPRKGPESTGMAWKRKLEPRAAHDVRNVAPGA